MSLKRLSAVLVVFVLSLSIPGFSQMKNRVAVSEADRVKLYEYNSASKEFDLVWESADIKLNSELGSRMPDLQIIDIDNDGKFELISVDLYGIFIWGKNGKFPQYFPFSGTLVRSIWKYITVVDLDGDNIREILTLGGSSEGKRMVSVWKITANRLVSLSEKVLPGETSWSLRHGDFDGDGKAEILTSSNLIHILGWKDGEGLVIEAEIPNLAQLVDVVRPADIDGDGIDEIIASGNSGCFSIYKHRKIHDKDYYPLYFQSLPEPGEKTQFSQGLHFGDIDGDGTKEILVGLTSRRGETSDNILIYKGFLRPYGPIGSDIQFEKVFSMPHESSSIPGFVIGDVDNDGQNEVIYNGKYVLKFRKDIEEKMTSESIGEISDRRGDVAIGPFYPSGEDKPDGLRLTPTAVTIDIDGDKLIESEETYQIRVKVKSCWHDVSQIRVRLESDSDVVEIEPEFVSYDSIDTGQEVENTEQPFILRTKSVEKLIPLELRLIIEAENGYRMEQKIGSLQSKNNSLSSFIRPKLKKISETIAISGGEGIYEEMGIYPEYFNDYYGVYWPAIDDLNFYKNLILYDELSYALFFHQAKLKSFLNKGGNFLLHGYYVMSKIEDPVPPHMKEYADFINTYLQVSYLDETDQVTDLKGHAGDVITDGLNINLKIGQGGNLPGVLEPLPSAIPILFFPDGQVAGVRIDGPYKMVILPFYLNDIESVEVRKKLLQRILDWFDQG